MNQPRTPVANLTVMRLLPPFIMRKIEHRPALVKILDNIGWLLFDKIIRMGVGLLVGVWVARYLGPAQFGQLNFALAFVALFGAIAGLGLNGIVVRDIVIDRKCASTTLGTAFALQLLGGLFAVVLIISTMAWLRPDDDLTRTIVTILSFTLLFKSTDFVKYWFESQLQSRYTVWVENGVFLSMTAIRVALIIQQATLMSFVWVALFESALISFGLVSMYMKKRRLIGRLDPSVRRAVGLLKDSWPLVLSSMAIVIYMRVDQVMLGEMLNLEVVGVYSAAARLSEVWYFIPMSIVASVFPAIIQARAVSNKIYLNRMPNLYNCLAMLSIVVAVFFTFFSGLTVRLLYGTDYIEAGAILSVQIWAGIFVSMGVARGKWLLAENLHHVSYWYIGIAMAVNVICNFILIPAFGAVGAAYATVLAQITTAIVAPAFFRSTRVSSVMLIKSLSPLTWVRMLRR